MQVKGRSSSSRIISTMMRSSSRQSVRTCETPIWAVSNESSPVLNGACDNGWCTTPNNSARYHVSLLYYRRLILANEA
jgi:hypothetical protein